MNASWMPAPQISARRAVNSLVLLLFMLTSRAWADAPDIEFRPPSSALDPETAMIMRDLAARLVPVYQESDPDRYLANLSVLQMAALDYTAADGSRLSLRDRRRNTEAGLPVGRGVVYDMYARARAMEADNRQSFAENFSTSFRDMVSGLSDQDAYTMIRWLETPLPDLRAALQAALDGLRNKERIDQTEAVELIRSYVSFDAYRAFSSLIPALIAEDDNRRYLVENETITGPVGIAISAIVVRPKARTEVLPALFEFTLSGSRNYAKECAAHGYAGVVAYARWSRTGPEGSAPFEHDGDDARAVIAWIAHQSWSDGHVGMYGHGYSAFSPWAAAKRPPAALKAIAASASMAPGVDFPMEGAIFRNSAYRWSLHEPAAPDGNGSGSGDDAQWSALDQTWYRSGRRYRDLGRVFGRPNRIFLRWLNHPSYDRYWQKLVPYRKEFARLNIPVLTTTGYYAASEPGDLYFLSQHLRYNARADHTLIIGPYDDGAMERIPSAALHGYQLDSAALADLRELRYQWFDHVLKGAATPSLLKDRINYEVMGANEWRHAPSLDAMAAQSLKFYLDAKMSGEMHLLTQRRNANSAPVQQTLNFLDRSDAARVPSGDLVGSALETPNAAVFASEPFDGRTELSGLFSGRLDFKVNKMDMDLRVMLYELRPDGESVRLFDPTDEVRASYARDRSRRHLLKAGERQELTFKSERFTSRLLQKGSRLVFVIGIDKRPDREINYGSGNDVSEESIADGKIPLKVRWYNDSYIEIPVHVRD
ncbi:MAG TPA: CocE/NonD family hydrolase [Steroidobacteraceae bacterium]|nr:CocE/NonD family hydrolase [Steroidobacteraceae bacterium]